MEPDLTSTEAVYRRIAERLGRHESDFAERWRTIREANRAGADHRAAGVLLLLQERPASFGRPRPELVFQLIKRSSRVPQGGDISCPGGMLDPHLDGPLALLTRIGVVPALGGDARKLALERPDGAFRIINLFFANALRESWEEIRLNPFNVAFLGPLPTYSLTLFSRTIFPLVGCVKRAWTVRPNEEVDRVIEMPLARFFEQENYAGFVVESSPVANGDVADVREFPCFVHREAGREEILWGATFNIILSFLDIVFDFRLEGIPAGRQYRRVISPEYITGRSDDR